MADDQKDRRLDALLDSLLSAYSTAEPRPGLDIRIRAALRARATQRRRQWILLLAASAAVAVFVVALTTERASKPGVAGDWAARTTSAGSVPAVQASRPAQVVAKTNRRPASQRTSIHKSPSTQLLLQIANAMPGPENLVFEREKLYLSPEPQPAPEPAVEPQASVPTVNVQELSVPTIEIKDLPSVKTMDLKGTYD